MTTENTPAPAPETTAQAAERNGIVGHRELNSNENAALLARLEKNGTPLEEVNKIAAKYGTEIKPDTRTAYEKAYDTRNPVPASPEGYNINLATALPHGSLYDREAIENLQQNSAQFAHALGLPSNVAGDLMRDLVQTSNRVAGMTPIEAQQYKARETGLLVRALGGPEKAQAALEQVQALLAKGDPAFVAAAKNGLHSSVVVMRPLHHAQIEAQWGARHGAAS